MYTVNTKKVIAMAFIAIAISSAYTFARQNDDKAILKAREAVQNASPDDWHTLAKSAEKCLNKKANLKEANEWIEKSIEIKPTVYNLGLKGDYYMLNQLPEKALEYYVKAMTTAKSENVDSDVSDIQRKIAQITNIGG